MDFKSLKELVKLISETEISEFKLENDDIRLVIRSKAYAEAMNQPETVYQQAAPQMMSYSAPAPVAAPVAAAPVAPAAPAAPVAPAAPAAENANYITIKSPMVGTFYRSPSPGKDAYVQVGDMVTVGQPVCIIEAMKLFNEVESEVSGRVVKVLADDASPVEYDQPLLLIDPQG